jgi:4a-hydroxytetrahydrobiopterin dehydratase
MSGIIASADLPAFLAQCPAWRLEGKAITRTVKLSSFPEAIAFVGRVADLAEEANHHPDFDIRYREVTLRLTTHSKGGLTGRDFDLARRIDELGT